MHALSLRALFRAVLLSALLTVGFSVVGCDSGGSSNGEPAWTGDWEVVSGTDFDTSQGRYFFSITEEQVEFISKRDGQPDCFSDTDEITNIDGNVITSKDSDGSTEEVRLEVSDNGQTLEVTTLDEEDEVTAEAVSEDPRDILNCQN